MVMIYHPETEGSVDVPAEAIWHYRQSGWLTRDEWQEHQERQKEQAAQEAAAAKTSAARKASDKEK